MTVEEKMIIDKVINGDHGATVSENTKGPCHRRKVVFADVGPPPENKSNSLEEDRCRSDEQPTTEKKMKEKKAKLLLGQTKFLHQGLQGGGRRLEVRFWVRIYFETSKALP